jgi:glycosyltransferase involved in cell wall biosynthesis
VSAALPALSGKLVVVEPVLLTPRLLGYYESVTRQGGVIGSTGLWDRTYDFGTVIQVFETLRTQQPELVSILELAVSTAGADPEYRREILTKIAASAYAPFIAVFEDHPDVLTRIARWSALLRATVRDSYGMAVREAIALGTPVVATDCCERPRTARVVPSGNHVMMIDAVRATLENPPDLSADRREIVSASAHALQQLVGVYQG